MRPRDFHSILGVPIWHLDYLFSLPYICLRQPLLYLFLLNCLLHEKDLHHSTEILQIISFALHRISLQPWQIEDPKGLRMQDVDM